MSNSKEVFRTNQGTRIDHSKVWDAIHKEHPVIIPVQWNDGPTHTRKPRMSTANEKALRKERAITWKHRRESHDAGLQKSHLAQSRAAKKDLIAQCTATANIANANANAATQARIAESQSVLAILRG